MFSYITVVHCIAGSRMLTRKSCHLRPLCLELWCPNSADHQHHCRVGTGWCLCKNTTQSLLIATPAEPGPSHPWNRAEVGCKPIPVCLQDHTQLLVMGLEGMAICPNHVKLDSLCLPELHRNSAALIVLRYLTSRKQLHQ